MLNTNTIKDEKLIFSDNIRMIINNYIMTYDDDIKMSLSQHLRAKYIYLGLDDSGIDITIRPSDNYCIAVLKLTNPCVKIPDKDVVKQVVNQYVNSLDNDNLLSIMQLFFTYHKDSPANHIFILWFCDNFADLPELSDTLIREVISHHYQLFIDYWLSHETTILSFTKDQVSKLIHVLQYLTVCIDNEQYKQKCQIIAKFLNKAILKFHNFNAKHYLELCREIELPHITLKLSTFESLLDYTEYQGESVTFIIDQHDVASFCDCMFNIHRFISIYSIINALQNYKCTFILNGSKPKLVAWNEYLKQAPTINDTIQQRQNLINFILKHSIEQ